MARMMNQNEAESEAKSSAGAEPPAMKQEENTSEGENASGKSTVAPAVAAPLVDECSSAVSAKATEAKTASFPLTTQLMNSKQSTREIQVGVVVDVGSNMRI